MTGSADLLTESYRYERKFVVPGSHSPFIDAILRRHPALFREIYSHRPVNNIYLDSPDLKSMEDNVDGVQNRVKTRIRWYGTLLAQTHPVLELKVKSGLVGRKKHFPLAQLDMREGCCPAMIRRLFLDSKLPETLGLHLSLLRPTLLNRYGRRYYLSADGLFRITVDTDLRFFPVVTAGVSRTARMNATTVLELKYDTSAADRSSEITQHLPFRVRRSSKYVTGLQMVYGIIPTY